MKIGEVFDPRNNALNAMRLALATEVMLFHSFPATGNVISPKPLLQLLFAVGVDGFFALSGFLITASWLRDPHLRDYLVARALRILPAFYVVLAVTAFVFAPLSVAIQGGSPLKLLTSGEPFRYILMNSGLIELKMDVGGTPTGIPMAGVWNGSLWSLVWEALCYLIVAVIGVVGLAKYRWVSPVILVLGVVGALLLPPLTFPGVWTIPQLIVRTAITFSAGAFIYQWRDVIPARWSLVAASIVIVIAASWLPDYRVVAAVPLAYAVIVTGALIKDKRFNLRTDLSYGMYIYAFPTQQLLAVAGLVTLTPLLFFGVSALATVPLAALSWFLVEKRALALKRRLKRHKPDAVPQGDQPGPPIIPH